MNYAYIRFSTDKQDETQQMQAIKEFCATKGFEIDAFEKDEGVSGGVSYKDRNLYSLVEKLKEGDTLVVSEISRLGRSMSDLNKLINDELKPRKIRLIVIKMGLDMDCANLKAIDEMIFFSLSFAAQVEKEMIQQRTQSAIDARKAMIAEDGGFFSKRSSRWTTKLGRPKGADVSAAAAASAVKKIEDARAWRESNNAFLLCRKYAAKGKTQKEALEAILDCDEMGMEGFKTRSGCKVTKAIVSRWWRLIVRQN